MKKRIVLAVVAILCVLSIGIFSPNTVKASASESQDVKVTGEVADQETLQATLEEYIDAWSQADFNEILEANEGAFDDETVELYKSWAELKDVAGEFQQILEENFTDEDGSVSAVAITSFENKKVKFTFSFADSQMTDVDVEEYVEVQKSFGERMKTAGINTVMSIAIVFCVLIFIAFIISLLKYVPKLLGTEKKAEAPVVATAPAAPVEEAEDVTDDTELVAVITAAIMASMGSAAPEDGLVISSIKRRTNSKWKKRA